MSTGKAANLAALKSLEGFRISTKLDRKLILGMFQEINSDRKKMIDKNKERKVPNTLSDLNDCSAVEVEETKEQSNNISFDRVLAN